jgi:hypothetical protein
MHVFRDALAHIQYALYAQRALCEPLRFRIVLLELLCCLLNEELSSSISTFVRYACCSYGAWRQWLDKQVNGKYEWCVRCARLPAS